MEEGDLRMNDPSLFEDPCPICKVRKATRLCDYVIHYDNTVIFFRNYKDFIASNENVRHETCDLPICVECAKQVNEADFCPHHYSLLKQVELPEDLVMAQLRSKSKIYSSNFSKYR